jgi:hypothetical protein
MSAFTLIYTRVLDVNWYSDTVDIPFPNVVRTGTNTAVISGTLTDSAADFRGIEVGDTVFNESDLTFAYVAGIESNTRLLLSDDIFTAGASQYIIYQGKNYGCYIYVPYVDYVSVGTGALQVETIGGDIVTFQNPPAGVLPVQVRKNMSGTTITGLKAVW